MITEPERQRRINIETVELQAEAWTDEMVRLHESGDDDAVAAISEAMTATVAELQLLLMHPGMTDDQAPKLRRIYVGMSDLLADLDDDDSCRSQQSK